MDVGIGAGSAKGFEGVDVAGDLKGLAGGVLRPLVGQADSSGAVNSDRMAVVIAYVLSTSPQV